MLTVERGRVRRHMLISLTPPATLVTLPITSDDAPNIYVTVQAWEWQNTDLTTQDYAYETIPDSLLRMDRVRLEVLPDGRDELKVTIEADQEEYIPRDTAVFTVTVTDQDERAGNRRTLIGIGR